MGQIIKTGTLRIEELKNKKLLATDSNGDVVEAENLDEDNIDDSDYCVSEKASGNIIKTAWTSIKTFFKTYFDTIYQEIGDYLTPANIENDIVSGHTDIAPSGDSVYNALLAKVQTTRLITINGVTYDLSADRLWNITTGASGYTANVYLTDLTSATNASYKQLSYLNDAVTTTKQVSVSNTETLIQTYIYDNDLETTLIDAGEWVFNFYGKVSGISGVSQLKFEIFIRTSGGTETTLFSKYSNSITNTGYERLEASSIQGQFVVNSTDRLGLRIYGKTTSVAPITISYQVGDDTASWFNTPLKIRHNQLRDLLWNLSGHIGTSSTLAGFDASGLPIFIPNSTFAPALGADDNYVTDAEKANLHAPHSDDQTISDETISISDVTTNNATTSKHGFLPKLSGNSTDVLKGDGTFGAAASGGADIIEVQIFS